MSRIIAPSILAALVSGLLPGCATTARMELPAFAAPTERIVVTGLGHGAAGTFRAGGYAGRFARVEERLGLFDPLFVADRGASSFAVQGPDLRGLVTGGCGTVRAAVDLDGVPVELGSMAYRCVFALDGQRLDADLVLRDAVDGVASLRAVRQRRGTVALNGSVLTVRSSNRAAGASLPTGAPIGYVFEMGGQAVGAVEINGSETVLHLPVGLDVDVRGAAILAGLALSVFRDPAGAPP